MFITMSLFVFFVGCDGPDEEQPPDSSTDETVVETNTTTETDTSTQTETTETKEQPGSSWTPGPKLPDCTPQPGSGDAVALSGVVLTPQGPQGGLVVYRRSTGLIECIGDQCATDDAEVVCTEGVISPGLIDAHNHMQYNVLQPWRHTELFDDRYDWQSDSDYWDYREAYDAIDDEYRCEIGKWAELRLIVSGATTAVGASGGSCIDILARNLDEGPSGHHIDAYDMSYSSSNVSGLDSSDASGYLSDLSGGALDAALWHVSEGVGGSVRDELDHMSELQLTGPGAVFVHATDATTSQLARMAADGTGLLWSPRSNLDLYAETTQADVARKLGVTVALGPDWTWSGSANPVRELQCARDYLSSRQTDIDDVALWEMATTDAARLLGLDGVMGGLFEGGVADIAVYNFLAEPYRAVIESEPEDVRLVIIDGSALYGVPELVGVLADQPSTCDSVNPCGGQTRLLCVVAGGSGDDAQTHNDIESTLVTALSSVQMPTDLAYAKELMGLWVCEDTRDSCDMSSPTGGDQDGDGVGDEVDVCPDSYDPLQRDQDSDGQGDVCDACPLNATATECDSDLEDIDGDGVLNEEDVCPWLYDDQSDTDKDGHGDSCDVCPDIANPGSAPCPGDSMSIMAIRDPSHPDHPQEGTRVVVEGVVSAVNSGYGFFLQDPVATEFGALYVYDQGEVMVSVGESVRVDGEYEEYYGLTELTDSVTTIIASTGAQLQPIVFGDDEACGVATGGINAERYEGMLVRVEDVRVSDVNPDDPDDFNEFEVSGCLRIDDLLCGSACWSTQPEVDTEFVQVTGPLTFSYSNHKLLPRDADDVEQ